MSLTEFFSAHSRAPISATIPQATIDLARSRDLLEIARQHTHLSRQSAVEFAGACPICGGNDRFAVHVKKQVFNCRGCGAKGGDAIALVQFVSGLSFPQAVERLTGADLPQRPAPILTQSKTSNLESDRAAAALKVWAQCEPINGTTAEFYLLNDRALHPDADLTDVLRYSPLVWHPVKGYSRAMIGLFRDIETDEPRAISRTFLDSNGHKFDRRFLGPVRGCAIKLGPATRKLFIGEGIETCLSAIQLGLSPVWALGSAGAIGRFPLVDGVEELGLLRERDDVNEIMSNTAGTYYRRNGRKVTNVWPPEDCKDLNDTLMKRARNHELLKH
jgi:hypothetical protein